MATLAARAPRWECEATLDRGDHGMGAPRHNLHRVGLIEVTDVFRWVPRDGLEWSLPIAELEIRSPPSRWRAQRDGVEMCHPHVGTFRVRALRGGRTSGRLRRELLARGAAYVPD